MTAVILLVIPGHAKREPGISRHNLEIPDRSACRGPSGMTEDLKC